MADIKIIAVDLDGTLLDDQKNLPKENRKAIEECVNQGIYVVPATGRTVYGIPETVRGIPGVRYAITINGGKVTDMEENKVISACLLTKEKAVEVMEIAEQYPIMYDAYVEGKGVSESRFLEHLDDYGITPGIQELIRKTRVAYPSIIGHIKEIDVPVEKITMFFTKPSDKSQMRKVLSSVEGILVSSSMPNNLEVNALGATKGGGILRLAEHLGFSREQTMAFGDGENDITMVEMAGLGVAMGNAAPFLKERADYITLTNGEAGVADGIRRFALKSTGKSAHLEMQTEE